MVCVVCLSQLDSLEVDSKVTSIGAIGFWLLVDDVEYVVPFSDYPVFQQATVAQIYAVQRQGPPNSIGPIWTLTSSWMP